MTAALLMPWEIPNSFVRYFSSSTKRKEVLVAVSAIVVGKVESKSAL